MAQQHWDDPPANTEWQALEPIETRLERLHQQSRETPQDGLWLGTNISDRSRLYITPDELSTHMHVIGATGVGKSYFIGGIIKSLILQGQGLCLIDPHGDLYHQVLEFCAYLDLMQPERKLSSRVIPFDVSNTEQFLGFNPVARNARVMTYQVVALMESIRKVWGQGSFQDTPRLARWLFNAAYAVIDRNLTFLQMQHLVDPTPNEYRKAIIAGITNPRIKGEWQWLSEVKDQQRAEYVESTLNRIKPFVENEVIRSIIGQHTNTLDFTDVMQNRKILLINLAKQNTISEDDQHLLGTLVVNELLTAAFARPRGQRVPHFLFIDEFAHFVTKDICEILDGGRKFGLHLCLAHQHLQQLKEKDPEVYYSTLTNARVKAVFGGLSEDDVDLLAKEFFTGELDPYKVKDEIWQTKYHPVETTRTIRTESASSGESFSRGTGTSKGSSEGHSEGVSYGQVSHQSLSSGEVYIPGSSFWSAGELASSSSGTASGSSSTSSRSSGASYSRSASSSVSESHATSSSFGQSTADVPWYEYHSYQELSSKTFLSLEEQLYLKKAQMKRQPKQHAAILIPESGVQLVMAPTVKSYPVSEQAVASFVQSCIEQAGCYKSRAEAETEIASLEERLLASTLQPVATEGTEAAAGDEQTSQQKPRRGRQKKDFFSAVIEDQPDAD